LHVLVLGVIVVRKVLQVGLQEAEHLWRVLRLEVPPVLGLQTVRVANSFFDSSTSFGNPPCVKMSITRMLNRGAAR
jgi:hypothetical protein